MSRGIGHKARVFVLCATLAGLAGSASAAPRRVAVVNVASDQNAGMAASVSLRAKLAAIEGLTPLPTGLLATALERVIPTALPSDATLRSARDLMAKAADARARFSDDEALAYLRRAERTMLSLVPDKLWLSTMVELNLLMGRIVLARPARAEAMELFRLVASLAPTLKSLDPAVYTPAEVKLFASVVASKPATATVNLTASYDGAEIWIDGAKAGVAPATITVPAGLHYVAAVFRDHTPEMQRVNWRPGQNTSLSLRLRPMSTDARARALRRRLLAPAMTGRDHMIAAARDTATLAGVDAVALLRSRGGAIEIAVYDGRADTLGPWKPQLTPAKVLLAPLLPAPIARPKPIIIPPPPPPPPTTPWYRKRWAQALVGSGIAATLVGGFIITRSGDGGPTMVSPPVFDENPFQ